jgi:hypothetical protein
MGGGFKVGTSWAGKVVISKERLRSERIQALMFCLEGFHCGAYDLAGPKATTSSPTPLEFNERSIDLAPVVLY